MYPTIGKSRTVDQIFNAIIQVETQGLHFNRHGFVMSPKGAMGVAQVMPETLEYYNFINGTHFDTIALLDRDFNMRVGQWYWNVCKASKPNIEMAISAYNMGINNDVYNWRYVREVKGCLRN